MKLEIAVAEEYATTVIADLPKRRTEIKEIDVRGSDKVMSIFLCLNKSNVTWNLHNR